MMSAEYTYLSKYFSVFKTFLFCFVFLVYVNNVKRNILVNTHLKHCMLHVIRVK